MDTAAILQTIEGGNEKKSKERRNMKIYGMSGYKYKATPTIILKDQWLKELAFDIGGYVSVSCENGKIVITPDAERAALKEAEAAFMERGKKVLVVDFEPQANLTTCFGAEEVEVAIGDLMMNVIGLSAVEAKLRLEMGTEKMLSAILEPLRDDYDYILIDTSSSLGALNINAMVAADEVIVTVNP